MTNAFQSRTTRRALLRSALGCTAIAARATQNSPAATRHPNLVILLADDLGFADLGSRGGEMQTPSIDRLGRESVEFRQCYSFPVCSPTRSALMTGRSPARTGILYSVVRPWSNYGLPTEEHILPQSLKAAGYQTAITGKWHLGHAHKKYLPNSRGFDLAYGQLNGAIDYFTHEREGGLDWHRNGKAVREEGYSTDLLAAEAVRFIKSRDRTRPFFLYTPFNAPHAPLQAPAGLIEKYASIANPRRRTFCAMVDALDTAAGRILSAIDEEGLRDNTIVLFFSDNGGRTNLGARNTPLRGAKATTFEGGIRVPAFLRWPGHLQAGAQSAQVITAMDVFPTLSAAAGVKPQNKLPFDGQNLWPAITSGRAEPREDLFFGVEAGETTYLALRDRDWKLVRELASSGPRDYLFRIDQDPEEKNDLSAQRPDLVKQLAGRIEKWRALYPPGGIHHTDHPPPGWKAPEKWADAAAT